MKITSKFIKFFLNIFNFSSSENFQAYKISEINVKISDFLLAEIYSSESQGLFLKVALILILIRLLGFSN